MEKFLKDLWAFFSAKENKEQLQEHKELIEKINGELKLEEAEDDTVLAPTSETTETTDSETETTDVKAEAEVETPEAPELPEVDVEAKIAEIESRLGTIEEQFKVHQEFKSQKEAEIAELKEQLEVKEREITQLSKPVDVPTIPGAPKEETSKNKKEEFSNYYEELKSKGLIKF